MRLFKMVELEEEVEVQFLAVYALRWQPEWGRPQYGFVEYEPEEEISQQEVQENDREVEAAPSE